MAMTDTDAATTVRMDELYRRMTPADKLERVRALTLLVERLAWAGLRSRHPKEPEASLKMRLARLRLGPDLFERVFPGALERDDT